MTGVCKWCGEIVEGPEVRPGLVVCEARELVGVSVTRRAHWLNVATAENVQKADAGPQEARAAA
jgi:hypothetical protein